MRIKKSISLLFYFLFINIFNAQNNSIVQQNFALYFGLTPPGMNAEIFAPGIISTGMSTRDIAITPDGNEIYFTINGPGYSFSTILFCKYENGNWTKPEVAPFAINSRFMFTEPCISPDGRKFFFVSNKYDSDSVADKRNFDIWVMNKTEFGWSDPVNLGRPVNSKSDEYFPSLTTSGTIYFTRENPDRTNSILRSKFINGKYSEPEKLPAQINFGADRFNAFVSPDESYIIVSVYRATDGIGATDYYIVFRNDDDTWREPINMGNKINSPFNEYSPYVSPDGKYFFFMSMKPDEKLFDGEEKFSIDKIKKIYNSAGNGNSATYWIDARIIDELKESVLK